ncbi:hypothetical protein JCM19992_01620 [Thermostilla marina]
MQWSLAGGLAYGATTLPHKSYGAPSHSEIPSRPFGKHGPSLPILGFGGAALVTRWGSPLSIAQRVELVRYAFEHGIRYFDTAGNYGESQAILGEALRDVRNEVYLVTKVETADPAKVQAAVESSLAQLQTDYLDGLLLHGTPGLEQMTVAQAFAVRDALFKLRDEGITRSVGFSAHGYFDKAAALIDAGGFDHCLLSYGYLARGHDKLLSQRMITWRNACVAKAHRKGMGIAAMKVMAAGVFGPWAPYLASDWDRDRLNRLPGAAIRYVLNDPRVDIVLIGMRTKADVDANIAVVSGDLRYTEDDRGLLAEFCARAFENDVIKNMKIEP